MNYEKPINPACRCPGPVNDEPVCPCQMVYLGVVPSNGYWVIPEKRLGLVKNMSIEQALEYYASVKDLS